MTFPSNHIHWIHAGLAAANQKLSFDHQLPQAHTVLIEYLSEAVAALSVGSPVPPHDATVQAAYAHHNAAKAMAAQFQNHLEAIEGNPTYYDRDFQVVDRWFDPAPPMLVDPGPGYVSPWD